MKQYVFFSLPAHGHVRSNLPIVLELVRRGPQGGIGESLLTGSPQAAGEIEAFLSSWNVR